MPAWRPPVWLRGLGVLDIQTGTEDEYEDAKRRVEDRDRRIAALELKVRAIELRLKDDDATARHRQPA